jgi:two-component system, OmpR family, sensor histidine kinase MtrB
VPSRARSLRQLLATITAAVALIAIGASVMAVAATSYLHRTSSELAAAVESVRLVQEAEIRLLLHMRTTDPVVRTLLEEDLRERLGQAEPYVTTGPEAAALATARERIGRYLGAIDDVGRQEAAFAGLHELVEINVAQARLAMDRAQRLDTTANTLGIVAVALVLLLALWLLWWARRKVFRPLFAFARTVEQYGRGVREARAVIDGPRELREMQVRFNEMATALATQRHAQMAFLGAVAHDLRNPLTALRLTVEHLGPGAPLPAEDRLRVMIARIGRHIQRLDRMTGDFLDAAKIEAGELELRTRLIDARDLVRTVADLFEPASLAHPIAVRTPSEPVPLQCDPMRIEQVLINLVSNAVKYSPEGGEVEIELSAQIEEIAIAVRDHGVGISPEQQETLFTAFHRIAQSGQEIPGVGLGLYGARRIVEAHGGRIDVTSTPGEGSTFRVRLPPPVPDP